MKIKAFAREESGKGVARALRRDGKVPAVLYGMGKEPMALALSAYDLKMAQQAGGFFTQKQTLAVEGGKDIDVLARDLQRDPVKDQVVHADFMYYNAKAVIRVMVGVQVAGEEESPGLKKGGVLQLVRAEVELLAQSDSIPEYVIVDMSGKDIGDSVHMSEIELPKGVQPAIQDRDFTVASVVGTRSSTMADLEDGEEGAAPAVGEAAAEEKAE